VRRGDTMKQWFRLTQVPGGNAPTGLGLFVQLIMLAAFTGGLLILCYLVTTNETVTAALAWVWVLWFPALWAYCNYEKSREEAKKNRS
jgi:hypothetical protein